MKTVRLRFISGLCAAFALTLLLGGCSGGGGGVTPPTGATTGTAKVSLTDAPTTSLDHVWVTVKEIRFHMSELCDDPDDGGWLRHPLATPVTLDLTALNNGIWSTLWDAIVLPVGNYQQIRVILAGTGDLLAPSAVAKGLDYNNQVDDNGAVFPLVIPAAKNGIKLIGSFRITEATPLHIVIDFEVTHDVVETGNGKYILKPRLKYFIVADPTRPTAAIVGTLLRPNGDPFANYTGFNPMITAEAPETITFVTFDNISTGRVMEEKRATTVRPDGTFVLYPLPVPAREAYDLVISGTGLQTMILQDVPVVPDTTGTAPSMFTIKLQTASDYPVEAKVVDADSTNDPVFAATVRFYQTLLVPDKIPIPYLIRSRDVNPLTGSFEGLFLATGMVQVGTFNPKAIIQSFSEIVPLQGLSSYAAVASAPFFWPSLPKLYSPDDTFNLFRLEPLFINDPPECDMDDDWEDDHSDYKGYYVTCGGLVVDHIRKTDLEKGGYEFKTANTKGHDIKSHGKGENVNLNDRKPVKIKIKGKGKK